MKMIFGQDWILRICAVFALLAPSLAEAQWARQTIQLRPGWNAVFLEVRPEPEDCEAQFAGLTVESVWDFNRIVDLPQFVQDPTTLTPDSPGWLTWFAANHPSAGQGNLFSLRDGRPYLIKVATNAQPITWTVTGRPSLRRLSWHAGGLNFVGFHLGAQAPSFQTLFAGDAGLTGQPVYSLDAGGVWRAFSDLSIARPRAGEAYWVRCRQPARATGTIVVDPGSREGLRFAANASEQSIRIRNASPSARNISVRILPSAAPPAGQPTLAGPVPLEYWRANYAATNFDWAAFSSPLSFTGLASGQEWNIRLGVRQPALSSAAPGSTFQSLLEVMDDLGTRWLVPVSAVPPTPSGLSALAGESSYAGLWVGDAVINAVSQPTHPSEPSTARPSGGDLSFRIIVHVDSAGTARLLQHVFLVRKPPVLVPDPNDPNANVIQEPARTVAVTDEGLIPAIVGPGQVVGRRISSAAFGFKQPVVLSGGGFGAGTMNGIVALDYDDPVNPFKHVYHPDHNNLDERFEQKLPEGREAFTVTRTLSLEFQQTDPLGLNPPGWGETELGGRYREAIHGLHRSTIQLSGNFRLVRVLSAAALNE